MDEAPQCLFGATVAEAEPADTVPACVMML